MTWTVVRYDTFEKSFKGLLPDKYRREARNLLVNLDSFIALLNGGTKPLQIEKAFIHREPLGVLAIDQRGDGKGLKQFRLYVYPDEVAKKIHLLRVGDKTSQRADIKFSVDFVKDLRAQLEKSRKGTQGDG